MLTVLTVEEARTQIVSTLGEDVVKETQMIPSRDSLGLVTAEDIIAPENVPSFSRAVMDGFAVYSGDTFGATEDLPALLELKEEIKMGQEPHSGLGRGEAMGISTGGKLPEGSDCVIMLEYTEILGDQVAVYRPVAPLENTVQEAEDFHRGDKVLSAGHRIRSQDIGVLAALGVLEIKVYKPPKVFIFSTGDEIVSPDSTPAPAQIRDVNGYLLSSLVREAGGESNYRGIVPDSREALTEAIEGALKEADMILISGGSSVGRRDHTVACMENLPGNGVLFHGVSMRPGKPLIFGVSQGIPVYGLSGNPVSAMFGFLLFAAPALRKMQGLAPFKPYSPYVEAVLDTNFSSPGGREDYVRVSLYAREEATGQDSTLYASPVFGGAALLSTVVEGDGYFVIPRDVEGLARNSRVRVYLF